MTASRRWTMSWRIIFDRRSQGGFDLSIRYSERMTEAGLKLSVASKGVKYDSALAETINGLYLLIAKALSMPVLPVFCDDGDFGGQVWHVY